MGLEPNGKHMYTELHFQIQNVTSKFDCQGNAIQVIATAKRLPFGGIRPAYACGMQLNAAK